MRNFILFGFILIIVSCQSHEYYAKVEKELASGQRYDSLFLDINFGMSQKEFYAHCWKLNSEGLLTHGEKNMTVKYEISEGLRSTAKMNFYPDFYEDKIYKMPVLFSYKAWAAQQNKLGADSLIVDVVKLYKQWHGDDFIELKSEKRNSIAYVNIKGNRQISIYKKNAIEVEVMYTDLITDRKIKENEQE